MLTLCFEGWWECRFATDPDPTDDPRGVSGPTFTVAGEPPFDRIIRLQNPVCARYPHEHDIGVTVRSVLVDGAPVSAHPLLGAAVDLLGEPQFTQRNLILVDVPFLVIVDPFDLQVSTGGIVVRRANLWDLTRPELTFEDVFLEPDLVKVRANQIAIQSAEVAEATGVMDYAAMRRRRRGDLAGQLEHTTDPTVAAGLRKRIAALDADVHLVGARLAGEQFLGMQASYAYPLNGTPQVEDPHGTLGGTIGTSQPWPLQFWLGGYDVDSLCGYMRGQLSLPFLPAP